MSINSAKIEPSFKKNDRLKSRLSKTKRQSSSLLEEAGMLGVVVAGVALTEVALVPGVLIGGIAILGPKYLNRQRKILSQLSSEFKKNNLNNYNYSNKADETSSKTKYVLGVKKTFAKTATFRILSSSLDLTWNYVLLGDIATAAGLSGFGFIASTTFYFIHEASWNKIKALSVNKPIKYFQNTKIEDSRSEITERKYWWDLQVSPALAKTLTFRSMATIAEFTTNYFVVRDVPMAAALSAFGFICGPFVYYAHEKVWENYDKNNSDVLPSRDKFK